MVYMAQLSWESRKDGQFVGTNYNTVIFENRPITGKGFDYQGIPSGGKKPIQVDSRKIVRCWLTHKLEYIIHSSSDIFRLSNIEACPIHYLKMYASSSDGYALPASILKSVLVSDLLSEKLC